MDAVIYLCIFNVADHLIWSISGAERDRWSNGSPVCDWNCIPRGVSP